MESYFNRVENPVLGIVEWRCFVFKTIGLCIDEGGITGTSDRSLQLQEATVE